MKNFRMLDWFVITSLLVGLVALTAPVQLKVLVFKVAQVSLSGWVGYWFDRGIAPYARPDSDRLTSQERSAAGLRRAIIIAAAMIAGALGA